jgi:DNA-binding protein
VKEYTFYVSRKRDERYYLNALTKLEEKPTILILKSMGKKRNNNSFNVALFIEKKSSYVINEVNFENKPHPKNVYVRNRIYLEIKLEEVERSEN